MSSLRLRHLDDGAAAPTTRRLLCSWEGAVLPLCATPFPRLCEHDGILYLDAKFGCWIEPPIPGWEPPWGWDGLIATGLDESAHRALNARDGKPMWGTDHDRAAPPTVSIGGRPLLCWRELQLSSELVPGRVLHDEGGYYTFARLVAECRLG